MTDVLTVGALGSMLLARWKLIAAFVVLGVGAGVAYGMLAPSTYTAKAVLFVIATPADKDGYYQAAQFAEKRAATYPALLSAPEVLDRTRTALDLDLPASALIPMLTATNPTDSSLVEVAATAATPVLAQQLAGTAAQYLADYAVDLEDSGTKVGAVTIKMAVPAREPQYPSSPSPFVLGVLGGLAGGALGVVVALTANAFGRRPRGGAGARATLSAPAASEEPADTGADGRSGHVKAPGGAHAPGHAPQTPPATLTDDAGAAHRRATDGPADSTSDGPGEEPQATDADVGRPTASSNRDTPVPDSTPRKRKRRRAHAPAGPARADDAVRAQAPPNGATMPHHDVPAAAGEDPSAAPAGQEDAQADDHHDDEPDGSDAPAQNGRPTPATGQPVSSGGPSARGGSFLRRPSVFSPRGAAGTGRPLTAPRGR